MIQTSWTVVKNIIDTRSSSAQYTSDSASYLVWTSDGVISTSCVILKDEGSDQTDFETNYKAGANATTAYNILKAGYGTTMPWALQLDNTSTANVTYVGIAAVGSATSAAAWQIKKIDQTSGLVITWAGSAAYNQIWNNRTSLTYT